MLRDSVMRPFVLPCAPLTAQVAAVSVPVIRPFRPREQCGMEFNTDTKQPPETRNTWFDLKFIKNVTAEKTQILSAYHTD